MERYKRRTVALCLASILTVLGAFGAENYNNSLMALKINDGTGGLVSVTAFTESPYERILGFQQIDSNTHIIVMPDTQSSAEVPDITGYNNIESIDIKTFPYTKNSRGYTAITIKTYGTPVLKASSALFIASEQPKQIKALTQKNKTETSYWDSHSTNSKADTSNEAAKEKDANKKVVNKKVDAPLESYTPSAADNPKTSGGSYEHMIVLLCMSVLLLIIGFIYTISKDKMNAVVGDKNDFSFDTDEDALKKSKKSKKSKNIKNTIKKLDKKYTHPKKNVRTEYDYSVKEEIEEQTSSQEQKQEPQEPETMIVDLDMLYQEKSTQAKTDNNSEKDEEDDDLADLLREFTFEEEVDEVQEEAEYTFDEELYNQIINDEQIKFSNDDIQRLNKLLQNEIDEQTITDIKNSYKKMHPETLSQTEILEDLLSTYSIRQNLEFSRDDVEAIQSIMNVELDRDFVKNLHTNPNRTKIVEKEISESSKKKPLKTSEIMTLNVKDMLPDLSKELKKQGNKKIESEAKTEVVYFSEGYEVEKLSVSEDLADISAALKSKDAAEFKPSYKAPVVESGYEVSTLSIKDELPDLADVKAHPKKYEGGEEKKEAADENSLLESLNNVTFKPFYEETAGTQKVENIPAAPVIQQETLVEPKQDIKSARCTENSECLLVETSEGYSVIGKINDKEFELKKYESLNYPSIRARLNDKNNKEQYLVKIGSHKIIIKVTEDNMEFVMDLC